MAVTHGRKGVSFQGPLTKTGSFRKKSSSSKKKVKKAKKMLPMISTTERRIPIVCSAASKTAYTIHLDKLLSQANHKLYRQGMNYHAKLTMMNSANPSETSQVYSVYTLPTNHRTIGALRMARSIYNQAVKDELEIRPEVKTAWTDFKIHCNSDTFSGTAWDALENEGLYYTWGMGGTLESAQGQNNYGISDAYLDSEVTDNAGNQRKFSLIAPETGDTDHDKYWNVIEQYRNYLLNRADPDSAAETPAYPDASPVLTELAELSDKGDEPPYSWAGQIYDITAGAAETGGLQLTFAGTISLDNNPRQTSTLFVEAPLGLIFISRNTGNFSTSVPELLVEALSGKYKGVKADRIYPKDKLLGF